MSDILNLAYKIINNCHATTLMVVTMALIGLAPSEMKAAEQSQKHFGAVLMLGQNDNDNSAIHTVLDAIEQQVPIICSAHLMRQIQAESTLTRSRVSDSDQWTVYINNDCSLAVLLPRGHNSTRQAAEAAENLGLINIFHVPTNQLHSTFTQECTSSNSLTVVKNFENIFNKNYKNIIKKTFFIVGHGQTNTTVADLQLQSMSASNSIQYPFMHFLKALEDIGTELIYIVSCYAGGPTLVELQTRVISGSDQSFSIANVSYPIIMQATTDEFTVMAANDLQSPGINQQKKRLFTNHCLKTFFERAPQYCTQRACCEPTVLLADVVLPIYDNHRCLSKLPSVRMPGADKFFEPIIVDQCNVISCNKHCSHLTSREKKIAVSSTYKCVLTYPAIVSAPIKFKLHATTTSPVQFISKIPGCALHMIDSMTIDKRISDITNLLKALFLRPLAYVSLPINESPMTEIGSSTRAKKQINLWGYGESLKAWFFKSICYKDSNDWSTKTLEDVVVVKYATPNLKRTPGDCGEIMYRMDNNYYHYLSSTGKLEQLSEEQFYNRFVDIYENTLPSAGALYEATRGSQTLQDIHATFAQSYPHAQSWQIRQTLNEIRADTSDPVSTTQKIAFCIAKFAQQLQAEHIALIKEILTQLIHDQYAWESFLANMPHTCLESIIKPLQETFASDTYIHLAHFKQDLVEQLTHTIYSKQVEEINKLFGRFMDLDAMDEDPFDLLRYLVRDYGSQISQKIYTEIKEMLCNHFTSRVHSHKISEDCIATVQKELSEQLKILASISEQSHSAELETIISELKRHTDQLLSTYAR